MEPFGTYTFEEIVDVYKEQVNGLLDGGVDLFVIETMMDIQEARAALLAVKETCDLPVMVTMTFERGGHTINAVSYTHLPRISLRKICHTGQSRS